MPLRESLHVSVEINAPIWRVYLNWRRLERFPTFVPSVKEARWMSKDRLYWREEYEGVDYETTFQITMNVGDNSLSWESLTGPENSGSALCVPVEHGRTRITLTIHYSPEGASQTRAAVQKRHQNFLTSFKHFIETKSAAEPPASSRAS